MKLRLKTILGIAFIEGIMLIILIISNINFLNSSNNDQIKQRATTTASLFAATTKDAVLSTDLASLETFVTEILKNPDVVYARVYSNEHTLASGGSEAALQQPFKDDTELEMVTDEVFDTHAIIQESGHQFGRVELGLSVASTNQIITSAWRWATGIATLEVLLVAFFSFVLGTWLTRQLTVLKLASNAISENGPGHQIPIIGNDEIAEVTRAFNNMSQNLADSNDELNKTLNAYQLAAEMARSNRATTRAILSSSLDAVITLNEKGDIIEFSKKAEEIFGFQHEEVVYRPVEELIIPQEYRDTYKKSLQHYMETGESSFIGQRLRFEALRKDGSRFPVELSISPINTSEGIHFASFIRDISDQVEADNQLRLAACAFESHVAIFVVDNECKIQQVNRAFTDTTGYQAEEVIGQNPRIMSSGKHDAAFYKAMWKELETNDRWEGEIYNRRKNGDILQERVSITVVRDAQNNIHNYVAHYIDITEQKKNERRLKEAHLEAEQANEAKSMFLANMSHE
ncbi:MAG: PAS domain S-box protein, partial [Gammaproteobacteria bacterium]|nr:PAS domain S-box protein [Gammaproteobacteria bacterium]